MGFPRQEYWSGLQSPSPGALADSGTEPTFPALAGGFLTTEPQGSPGISLEGMVLKLKLQYFGHLMRRVDSLEKTDAGRDWGQEEKGTTEDEMAGWHH